MVLSPLGLLSFDSGHPVWMGLNIAMAVLAPYFAARFFRPHDPFRVIVAADPDVSLLGRHAHR